MLLALVAAMVAVAAVVAGDVDRLRRALSGETAARRELVEHLLPVVRARVHRVLRRRSSRAADAAEVPDLVQEVWLALMNDDARVLRAWDPARGATLGGYVGMVAEREVGNQLDRMAARKRGGDLRRVDAGGAEGDPAHGACPEGQTAAHELATKLMAHLEATLPVTGRLALRLLYTDQRAPAEVARLMGTTANAVYIWQHRIRKAARAFIADATVAP